MFISLVVSGVTTTHSMLSFELSSLAPNKELFTLAHLFVVFDSQFSFKIDEKQIGCLENVVRDIF